MPHWRLPVQQPNRAHPPRPRWTIEDLIDLEYLLSRPEAGAGPLFFETEVEPWIQPERIGRPDRTTMSRALWQWLGDRRRSSSTNQLPGRAYAGALTMVTILAMAGMAVTGSGVVLGLLNQYDGRTFHVLALLGLTLGVPWLIILLSLLALVTVGWWTRSAFLSAAQGLLHRWITWLARRSLGEDAANWWRETSRTRGMLRLPALKVSQLAGLSYSAGATAALLGCVFLLSVRFGWETTTVESMAPVVQQGAQWLALPWSWIRPDWVPTREVIEGTLITWSERKPVLPPADLSARWYPFLLASLVFWGILPRLFLAGAAGMWQGRVLGRYSFLERRHREWWRQLTATDLHVETSGPADGAFALLHGGFEEPADLRRACLQQLRINIEDRAVHGLGTVEDDVKALDRAAGYLGRRPGSRLVVVAEGWGLAPKAFRDFHEQVRAKVGRSREIDLFLIGLPGTGGAITPPEAGDVVQWERFVAELGDDLLYVRPFQPSLAV